MVILSTHIVADIADLCGRMAVLARGRVLAEGVPLAMLDELYGRVWRKAVDAADLAACRARHRVLSTRLLAGRRVVHVLADARPAPDFEPVPAGLEDVYFAVLTDDMRATDEGAP